MMIQCPECGEHYDDFDRSTICPHERFGLSDSTFQYLCDEGIMCARCQLHVQQCMCED